jgi:hypothetical protein
MGRTPPKARIFVSYRRQDSSHQAGRIFDWLENHFGRDAVFKDVDSIPLGVDFRKVLTDRVASCDVLVSLIGDNWLTTTGSTGERRLDDVNDFVRIELEAALQRGVPVIPVLVGIAPVPPAADLPPGLKDLSFRNGMAVRPDPDFRTDVERLARGIEHVLVADRTSTLDGQRAKVPVARPLGPRVELGRRSRVLAVVLSLIALTAGITAYVRRGVPTEEAARPAPGPAEERTAPFPIPTAGPGEVYLLKITQLEPVQEERTGNVKVSVPDGNSATGFGTEDRLRKSTVPRSIEVVRVAVTETKPEVHEIKTADGIVYLLEFQYRGVKQRVTCSVPPVISTGPPLAQDEQTPGPPPTAMPAPPAGPPKPMPAPGQDKPGA